MIRVHVARNRRTSRTGRKARRRRILPAIGRLAVAGALLLAIAWAVGLVLGDSRPWSQPLSWIPTWPVAAALWVAVGVSRASEWGSRRMAGTRLRPFALLAAAGLTLFTLWTWSPWRLVTGAGPSDTQPGEITASYWNLSWAPPPADTVELLTPADLVIVANPRSGPERAAFHEQIKDGAQGLSHSRRLANWTLLSRWPIAEAAYVRLPTGEGTTLPLHSLARQTLGIGLVTLDTTAHTGRPMTVWIVDLPSDPRLHRPVVMRAALDAVRAHAAFDRHETPDLVIGDFNTPRGAGSLDLLVPGMTESHAAVGIGPGATWPRPAQLWAIDLAFASRDWLFHNSETIETGSSLHRAIRVRLAPRVPTPQPADPQLMAPQFTDPPSPDPQVGDAPNAEPASTTDPIPLTDPTTDPTRRTPDETGGTADPA